MWTAVFVITTIICAIGWLAMHMATIILICYIEKKGYNKPTELEIDECAQQILKQVFKVK